MTSFRRATLDHRANFWRCNFIKIHDFDYANFDEAVFRAYTDFSGVKFGSQAWFRSASLEAVTFGAARFAGEAVFQDATFGGSRFAGVEFGKEANFFSATFKRTASFTGAKFKDLARFELVTFCDEALFWSTWFETKVSFWTATFKDYPKFSATPNEGGFGDKASCDFRQARFEKPDRVSFHTMALRPHWFLDIDPRKLEFVDVKWVADLSRDSLSSYSPLSRQKFIANETAELLKREEQEEKEASRRLEERKQNAKMVGALSELEELEQQEADAAQVERIGPKARKASMYRLLSITCRQLAVNAEENHRYDEASDFRFWSMELRRKEGWRGWRRASVSALHTLDRYLSGYGEDVGRALSWLALIWLLFAFLYTLTTFQTPATPGAPQVAMYAAYETTVVQRLPKALAYSLAVMTLQKPDPHPLPGVPTFTVLAETILGPIQAALFLLAVRRRFIR